MSILNSYALGILVELYMCNIYSPVWRRWKDPRNAILGAGHLLRWLTLL